MRRVRSRATLIAVAVIATATAAAGASAQAPLIATIDNGPKKQTKKRSAKFFFSSDDPAATFECRLDAPPFAACLSPLELNGLDRGRHAFEVRAIAPTGAVSGPAVQKWKIVKRVGA